MAGLRSRLHLLDAPRRPAQPSLDGSAILVGIACVVAAVAARLALEQLFHGIVPFLLTFPAVIVGTLIAGAGAGWIALVGCQALTLLFVLPNWRIGDDVAEQMVNLVLATFSLALAVWATASYRRSALQLRVQCEREVDTLSLLINEIDHRTKNNFQIAASLLYSQGLSSPEPGVKDELQAAANRLVSMAAVYQSLSLRRLESGELPLTEHVEEVCAAVRASMLPPGIALAVEGGDVRVKASTALTIGLVVNEWVTNAVKYAFPAGTGTIDVRVARAGEGVRVEVADDGVGMPDRARTGVGSRLMATLAEALGGTIAIDTDGGTRCTLDVPAR